MRFRLRLLAVACVCTPLFSVFAAVDPLEQRVQSLLAQLTLEEKISLLGGDREFYVRPIPRLGLPEIKMADGPLGVRNYGKSTAYPATVALAATWNRDLARTFGESLARDCRARGVHVMLAPGMNIQRVPHNGRNFEYFSEDPALTAALGAQVIRGIQSQGVVATAKHFAANNQEEQRKTIDVRVEERALREIYFPQFKAAVDAGAGAFMTSYNRLNGPYTSAHSWLNLQVLKGEWGFRGVLMSDWGATHDTLGAANGGLDLEMPSGANLNAEKLRPLLDSGAVSTATIDAKVARILRLIVSHGFLDRPQKDDSIPLDDPQSAAVAHTIASQGIVLLKNEGATLPLKPTQKRIVVLGPLAAILPIGGGSSRVEPFRASTLVEGIRTVAPPGTEVEFIPGAGATLMTRLLAATRFDGPLTRELFAGMKLEGAPVDRSATTTVAEDWSGVAPHPQLNRRRFSARWTGSITAPEDGTYTFMIESDDGSRVFLDDREILDLWSIHTLEGKRIDLPLKKGQTHRLRVEYFQRNGDAVLRFAWGKLPAVDPLPPGAAERVRQADAVVVAVGYTRTDEAEGRDRSFALPEGQEALIQAATALNPATVVAVYAGGAVATEPWLAPTRAVLQTWFPGQEGGRAVAEILFGRINPSGKLPFTYDRRWEENAAFANYPGRNGSVTYAEGIFVGYRWTDHAQLSPAFPFGHGLSYTSFAYEGLSCAAQSDGSVRVTFSVENRGSHPGAEVAQVYVAPPAGDLPRPVRELKEFARVELAAGERKTVEIRLSREAFALFDPRPGAGWRVPPGTYGIDVGASSRDLRLRDAIEIK
jgi:beta-glucosidase